MVDCMFELFFVKGFLQKDLVLYLLSKACGFVVVYKHDFDVSVRAFSRFAKSILDFEEVQIFAGIWLND